MQKEVLCDNIRPKERQLVKLKRCGDISEIMWSEKRNTTMPITKLSDDYYILNATGEIKEFEHKATSRADNLKSVAHSLARLRDYINCNVTDTSKIRWCTLTYAENMTDTKRLYKDFDKFIKRFRYRYSDYGKIEYIIACEPQGRGAWHIHALFIFPCTAPFIPNSELAEIWGQGFVNIKKLVDCDNIGAYLTAYLGDMELSDAIHSNLLHIPQGAEISVCGNVKECDVLQDDGTTIKKKFIKGARLRIYPDHFQLYRCSLGIKKPEIEIMENFKAEKKVSADTLTFEKTVTLSDEDFSNIINYRYYNAKR